MVYYLGGQKMKRMLLISVLFALILAAPVVAADQAELIIGGGVVEKVVQPGDSLNLRFTLQNTGAISASSIQYEIIADASVSGYSTGKVNVGGVAPGETRTVLVPLIVSSTASSGEKSITVKAWYSGGKQSPVQNSFTFTVGSDVSLYLSDITFDEELIEPGKDIALTAVVLNVGENPAHDIFGNISANSTYIKPVLAGGEYFVSDLASEKSAEFRFMINVDSDAETETYDATITLSYKDQAGNTNTKTFNIGIPVSGTPKLEVLNTEIDGTDFKVEMENLGTAKAKAIRVKLVQDGEIMGVKIDNELKPDKHSTLRYKAFKAGPGKLELHYLDNANNAHDEVIDVEVPGASGGGTSKWTLLLFVIVIGEGYYIYKLRKKSHLKLPFLKSK